MIVVDGAGVGTDGVVSGTGTDSGVSGTGTDNGKVTLHGKPFVLEGPASFEPEYVSNIELDLVSKRDSITDQCGRTEIRKNGDSNWTVTVEGIMSDAQLSNFKAVSTVTETLTATTILHSGEVIVDSATATQKEDDVYIEFIGDGTDGMAIHFQLQLKQPSSQNGGGVIPNFS